ncbi:MAG: hypothetical protein ACYC5X_17515 [Syntrophales bacterium]
MTKGNCRNKMKKMIVIIAGTSVLIEPDEAIATLLNPLNEVFRGFLEPRGPATIRLTVSYNNLETFRKFSAFPLRLTPNEDRKSLMRQVQERYRFSEAPLVIGFLNGILAYNGYSQRGHLYLFRSNGKNFIMGSLHKLLFLFMAIALTEQGKLMIHGAGLRLGSEGCLFVGDSGSGKTTVAGYAPREGVLSDDAPVVTRNGGEFTIHASPFSQVDLFDSKAADHHRQEAPLRRLIFLKQADHLELECRDKRSALAELLQAHIHGFDIMDKDLRTRVFQFCGDLCAAVHTFDLYFQKDNRFLSQFVE